MPLTELIRYFNVADSGGDSTLYPVGDRVAAWSHGLRLNSLFKPIVDLRRERIVGHQALLQAEDEAGRPVDSDAAYTLCPSGEAVVHFDRLIRTLHALNFLAQRRLVGGYLQLAVHPRHLHTVQNQHGLVYEAILKRCGLAPEDIVLDIDGRAFAHNPHLGDALHNYRLRGYRLALSQLDDKAEESVLTGSRPDIVKLAMTDNWCEPFEQARRLRISVELDGIESGRNLEQATALGVELGQGSLFGPAGRDCRPTHNDRRVAYNPDSPSGAQT